MSDLTVKWSGRKLTTDEVAEARTAISKEIGELESIDLDTGPDSLLLKWGTLKGSAFHSEKALALLQEYGDLGSSITAMSQKDNPRQKEIICGLIDVCDGVIQNDWSGEYFTKQQAKEYVMGYDES